MRKASDEKKVGGLDDQPRLLTGFAGEIFQTGPQVGKMTAPGQLHIGADHQSLAPPIRRKRVPTSLLGETMGGADAMRFTAIIQRGLFPDDAAEALSSTP